MPLHCPFRERPQQKTQAMAKYKALLFICLLSACTALAGPARIDGFTGTAPAGFPGLLPSGMHQTTYIFQIHGIDTPDPNYGEDLLGQIPNFGYTRTAIAGPVNLDNARNGQVWNPAILTTPVLVTGQDLTPTPFDHFGYYRKDVFNDAATGNRIVVFTYFWRSDLWSIDGQYLNADIASNQVPWPSTEKSSLDEYIKTGLMDNGLSDVAAYLGALGPLEREGTESAVCAMFADAIGTPQARREALGKNCLARIEKHNTIPQGKIQFDFLSHSLGSRMLFDVLSPYDPDAQQDANARLARSFIADNTRVFFMAANQLPILAIGQVVVSASGPRSQTGQAGSGAPQSFFDLRSHANRALAPAAMRAQMLAPSFPKLSVVAFQDPDDLLGFKASDGLAGGDHAGDDGLDVIDVLHRNADQWFFLFVNPTKAHNKEMEQVNSRQMILCGATIHADGSMTANPCLQP